MSTSTILLMCGLRWIISINQAFYACETSFDKDKCLVQVICDTGYASYDVNSKIVSSITEQVELDCSKKNPQSRSLNIMNEFAAAISCIKE